MGNSQSNERDKQAWKILGVGAGIAAGVTAGKVAYDANKSSQQEEKRPGGNSGFKDELDVLMLYSAGEG